ncbi:beta-propeller domain-containing protein [Actinomadura sp. 9N407]|uniref:beta-propeller domain-containing protein n=1 Tax=Actinomadura sp. 9N407 TaxID=3375154 RepID=UPI0037A77925
MRLVAYDGCDEVLDGLRTATERRVGPYGLNGDAIPLASPGGAVPEGAAPDGARAQGAAPVAPAEKPADHSRTNAHEAGADEPDLVKTDGRRIFVLAGGRLNVIDPATREVVHRLDLPGAAGEMPYAPQGDGKLLLSGDRALILSPHGGGYLPRDLPGSKPARPSPQTVLTLVDLSGTPKVVGSMTTSSDYVDARQSGSIARVVVTSAPHIDFPHSPRSERERDRAVERNRRIVRSAPLDAWLPSFEVRGADGRARTYKTPCDQVSRPEPHTGTTMLSVLTLDLSKDLGDPAPISIAADGQKVYGTGSSLYITGGRRPAFTPSGRAPQAYKPSTDVHKFVTTGPGRPRYVASGSVPGTLLNQYSMSEHAGNLRMATTSGSGIAGSRSTQSAVYVLGQRDARLSEIGKVDGLGLNERIYSVRFIGPTAYVVTFRQVDPLYVVDLKNPARPRVTGELKIPGYSAYLHPMADGRLLGIGQDADGSGRTRGTQVSLFDVSAGPRRVDSFQLPGTSATAEFEPHAFLYWPKSGLTVVPVADRSGESEALVLKVDRSGIHRLGAVAHPGGGFEGRIQRSLIVGDTLWTVSDTGARATDAATLDDRAWLEF